MPRQELDQAVAALLYRKDWLPHAYDEVVRPGRREENQGCLVSALAFGRHHWSASMEAPWIVADNQDNEKAFGRRLSYCDPSLFARRQVLFSSESKAW
jgi:hypothetical protein